MRFAITDTELKNAVQIQLDIDRPGEYQIEVTVPIRQTR